MSFCEIILVGRIGKDPELKYLPSGTATTEFSLATNRKWIDKATGEKREEVAWFRVHVYGAQAEATHQFVQKGKQVLVVADRIEANAWTDKASDEARASLDVTARTVRFLDGKREEKSTQQPHADGRDDIPF